MLQQKEQLSLLGRKLEQWREEEDIVRTNVEKHRQSLVEVLRQGEVDAHSLQQHIKVHSFNNCNSHQVDLVQIICYENIFQHF